MEFKNEIGWLKQNTFEIKKNDVVVIGVDEGKVTFYKNNEIMAKTQNIKLAKIILKLTNSNSKIKYMKLPQDDPKRKVPELNLAIKKIKWRPKTNLESGLTKTIDYFTKLIK